MLAKSMGLLPSEEWRPIAGFPGYEISSDGRVRSHMLGAPRILKPAAIPSGHRYVMLRRNKRQSIQYIHRLVCRAWHGEAPDGHQAAHLDGDCNNNVPSNLIWATPKENNSHKYIHGTMASKLSRSDVLRIAERLLQRERATDIAKDYGVKPDTISDIKLGRSWKAVTGFSEPLWIVRRPRKLNAEAVRDIVHRLERGEPQASIARHHGVDPRTIRDIKTGKSWKCITELEPA